MKIALFAGLRQRQSVAWLTALLLAVSMLTHQSILLPTLLQNYYFVRFLQESDSSPKMRQQAEQVGALATRYAMHAGINRLAGRYYQNLQRWPAARSYWQQAATLLPADKNALFWLAKSAEALGDYGNALRYMHRAGQPAYFPPAIGKLSTDALRQVALATSDYQLSGKARSQLAALLYPVDPALAQQQFERAIQQEPQSLDNIMNAAWFYYQHHKFEQAKTFGELATVRFRQSATVQLFWGAFYKGTGKLPQAQTAFAEAVKLAQSPGIAASAQLGLADILVESGQYAEALRELAVPTIQLEQFSATLIQAQATAGLGDCVLAWTRLDEAATMVESTAQENALARRNQWVIERCPR